VKRARYVAGLIGAVGVAIALPVSANAATRTVTMGTAGKNAKKLQQLGSDVNDFFPHSTTVHVGDKVKFLPTGFHTVEFPAKGQDPAPLAAPTGKLISGSNDAAGQPFWFNGQPEIQFNPVLFAALYGKKVKYNGSKQVETGLPLAPKPKPVTVRFTKAGKYTYFCNIHPGMKGTVTVAKKSKAIPSNKAHNKKVATQYKRDIKIAKRLPHTVAPAGIVDVGVAGKHGVEFFGMVPAKVTVPAGQALQFRMSKGSFEDHTATFGPGDINDPNSYVGAISASFQGASLDQRGVLQSEAPSTTGTLTPTLHGNGFWNSGIMDTLAGNPLPGNNTVRFGAAGTYKYYCLIHPFMVGEVTVQ
jgi:plastocyanin